MVELHPFYNAFFFGTLLSALEKMGINPMLITRQTAKILGPQAELLAKDLTGDKDSPATMDELAKLLEQTIQDTKCADQVEGKFSGNSFSMKITNCMYQELADYGKSLGYNNCLYVFQLSLYQGS